VTLKQCMGEFWQHRYGALIWWIALRYFIIGLEYLFGSPQSMAYWLFGGIYPAVVGTWMVLVGSAGLFSRYLCRKSWTKKAAVCTQIFAFGVCVHSFFRLAMFAQSWRIGDPLVVLFVCDLVAMFFVLVQIQRAYRRQCLP
jgi:hypothetical protein